MILRAAKGAAFSLIVVAALVLLPGVAAAIPHQARNLELLFGAYDAANTVWADTGQPTGCTTAQLALTEPREHPREVAWTIMGRCATSLNVRFYRAAMFATDRLALRTGLMRLCVVLAHELGHSLGLEHSATGLMQKDPQAVGAPHQCVEYAVSVTLA